MALTNTADRYGGVTKSFHWLTALLILTLIPTGWYANQLPYETDAQLAQKAWLFSLHKTLGVTTFFVALLRILWAASQPKPGLLHPDRKLESFAAETVHWLLYGALVIVPLSGWISHAAAQGFAPIWWPLGQNLPLVPKSVTVEHFFAGVHWITTKVLIAALVLHIAGALKHHIVDRDATLRRMLPGRTWIGTIPPQRHSSVPFLAALLLWVAAIAVGGSFAVADRAGHAEGTIQPALEEVASDWQVQEGTIDISITQFGSEVTGSFADWTSAITFDETIAVGDVGTVLTTISIPSLTLGSVTQQAMGPDFFDSANHPTATYDAVIRHAADGYEAVGDLTIRGNSVPVILPLGLAIDGDTAELRAITTLDRRNFGVGDNVKDEASLAFNVTVQIALTAQRGAPSDQ